MPVKHSHIRQKIYWLCSQTSSVILYEHVQVLPILYEYFILQVKISITFCILRPIFKYCLLFRLILILLVRSRFLLPILNVDYCSKFNSKNSICSFSTGPNGPHPESLKGRLSLPERFYTSAPLFYFLQRQKTPCSLLLFLSISIWLIHPLKLSL